MNLSLYTIKTLHHINILLNSYLIGLLYALIESYIFAIIAVSIHNKIIKKNIIFTLFSKGIIIYAVFYLANHAEFLLFNL